MVGIIVMNYMYQDRTVSNVANELLDVVDNSRLIDFYKSSKLERILDDRNKSKILKCDISGYDGWDELYAKVADFINKNGFTDVFIYSLPITKGFDKNSANKISDLRIKMKSDKRVGFNFMSAKRINEKIIIVKACSDYCNIYHLVFDTCEVDFGKGMKFKNKYLRKYILNSCSYKDVKYAPFYEMSLFDNSKACDKTNELFFAGSAVTAYRKEVICKLKENLEGVDGVAFFYYDNKENRNKKIPQSKYYEWIERSRYTLVIKSYDPSTFSIIRFFESVCRRCVPLILDDVPLDDLRFTFPDIYDIVVKRGLVVSLSDVQSRIGNYEKDKSAIDEIVCTKSFKKITNPVKVRRFYEKMLGGVSNV